jgi:hypothetical protein
MRLIGVMLVCVGCHGEGTMQPDSAVEPDGPATSLGMSVTWSTAPAVPGSVTDKVTVLDVNFQIDHLQLLSDAGADERTTRSHYQLRWDASMAPGQDTFPDAPAAVYQKISLDVRQGFPLPYAYQIQGLWRDEEEDEAKPFRIVDAAALSIPIACSVTLAAGGKVAIAIRLDLRDALNGVDWKNANEQDGKLTLSGKQLGDFHDRLTHAFKLDN